MIQRFGRAMVVSEDVFQQFGEYLKTRGGSTYTIASYLSHLRQAMTALGQHWTTTTDFGTFVSDGETFSTREGRRTSINRFVRWLSATGADNLPTVQVDIGARPVNDTPAIDLAHITAAIQTADLSADVAAIFLLITQGALLTSEVLGLTMRDVDLTSGVLTVRRNTAVRPYPLWHLPDGADSLRTWYTMRRDAGAADGDVVFITRQQGQRTPQSLRRWWSSVVGEDGPTLQHVQQAAAAQLQARYPHVADTLLGYTGAPRLSVAELRSALI